MEPVSLSASVLTIAETAAHVVIYIRKVKTASKDLSNFKKELQSLRNELEEIADLLERAESDRDAGSTSRLPILQRLADPGNSSSPLARCHEELTTLVKELERSGWGPQGSRRSATVKALTWPFKQQEITKTLESIKSLKATMSSGLRNDEVYVPELSIQYRTMSLGVYLTCSTSVDTLFLLSQTMKLWTMLGNYDSADVGAGLWLWKPVRVYGILISTR